MEIFKLTLTVSGSGLNVEEILKNLSGNLSPYNKIFLNENYGYALISFMHPNIFSPTHSGFGFEDTFVSFIEENKILFIMNGVEELDLFTEFYYSDNQCNFEILTGDLLLRLSNVGIKFALPISVYKMKEEKLIELLNIDL